MKLTALLSLLFLHLVAVAETKPNIVWLFGEDMGPELGCYGDKNALTPNMDRVAREGVRFTHAFTHAPVCAPSRSGLITGRYPTSIGTHHMRSRLLNPPPMFTESLRKAGYTICWPTKSQWGKTDFNFEVPKDAFDVRDDWTKQKPKEPFFAMFNDTRSHESKIRADKETYDRLTSALKPSDRHDPAKMEIPPYHPDTPEVRHDLAQYYDLVTGVDYKMGEVLATLDRWGIASNTVVIVTGDHGRGLPRSKRWVYDSGIHVPLIVRWPGHIKPGTVRDDLVSFIDFAPTMMSLAGVPESAQKKTAPEAPGAPKQKEIYPPLDGVVFLGKTTQKRKYVFAARDRMDEVYDRIRAVRDDQFKYIRNFAPELPYSQRIVYGEVTPTMKAWREGHQKKTLNATQELFFAKTKPKEELYDCNADPHEVHNLAADPKYAKKLKELSAAMDKWLEQTQDLGAVPEKELVKRGLVEDRLSEYETRKAQPE